MASKTATCQFLALREVLPDMGSVQRLVQSIRTLVPARVSSSSLGNIAIEIQFPMYEPEALDLEVGYLITGKAPKTCVLSESRTLTLHELPAVDTLATVVHVGRIDGRHHSYGRLGGWLERNNMQIIGKGREILLQLPGQGNGDEAVVEIQLPVGKVEEKVRANEKLRA